MIGNIIFYGLIGTGILFIGAHIFGLVRAIIERIRGKRFGS